jgi:hypothetical protein
LASTGQLASTPDAQSAVAAESDEHILTPEQGQETFASLESDAQPASALDAQALIAPESDDSAAVTSDQKDEAPAEQSSGQLVSDAEASVATESDVQVTVSSAQTEETFAPQASNEPPASTPGTQAHTTSESQDNNVLDSEVNQEGPVGTASDGQIAADADRGAARPAATGLVSQLGEQGREGSESGDQMVDEQTRLASIGSATVEQHVVEEHVVPEHVVNENVVPQDQLSVSDDSVTESSSEADNSDAEPSR